MSSRRALKYDPLRDHMMGLSGQTWPTTFEEIEGIIAAPLPASARQYQPFWARESEPKTHVWKKAWMAAGWEVDSVDLVGEKVTFRRIP